MLKILLIEDDVSISNFVQSGLRSIGHSVVAADDGRQGLIEATTEEFDVIILDRMLPSMDGLKILQALRASGDETPVIILSALGEVDERVRGLRAGSDDYLTKPFSLIELTARLEALARRPQKTEPHLTSFAIGPINMDLLGQVVRCHGKRVDLTAREFRILTYFARNEGKVVTRNMLLEAVWDYNFDPQTNIVDQHVSKLRQKLDAAGSPSIIQTVRGAGYVLRLDN